MLATSGSRGPTRTPKGRRRGKPSCGTVRMDLRIGSSSVSTRSTAPIGPFASTSKRGHHDGKFDKLKLVADGCDLEIFDLKSLRIQRCSVPMGSTPSRWARLLRDRRSATRARDHRSRCHKSLPSRGCSVLELWGLADTSSGDRISIITFNLRMLSDRATRSGSRRCSRCPRHTIRVR